MNTYDNDILLCDNSVMINIRFYERDMIFWMTDQLL